MSRVTNERRDNFFAVARLAACVINDEKPDRAWCESLDFVKLRQTAEMHLLSAIVAEALERAGISDQQFKVEKAKAIQKSVLFNAERTLIMNEFEKSGIWYVPLKGAILQNYYPGIGFRQMADNDLLIDSSKAADVKRIMEEKGYQTIEFSQGIHDIYYKKPVLNFEMHSTLFEEHVLKRFSEYYANVKEKLIKNEEKLCEYHFSREDFYVYLIAHEYNHFSRAGTGLRSLLDTYVYLKRENLNMDYVSEEMKKLGIEDFEAKTRVLAIKLFDGEKLTDAECQALDYFINSGAYGNYDNIVDNQRTKQGWSRLQYLAHRFFVPINKKNPYYARFAAKYPIFYRHKILLPFLPIHRLIMAVRNGRFKGEINAVRNNGK